MTDLYTCPGTADAVVESLADNPEAQMVFAAEIAYARGEIDKVLANASKILHSNSGFYAVNAGGMLQALAAMWIGDIALYREAKVHICGAPWKTAEDKQLMQLSLACIDSAVRDISIPGYPAWFRQGQFEHLHPDSHPAAKVFYIKYLLIVAQEHAKGSLVFPDVSGMGLMRVIPYIAEPLIAQVVAEKLVVPEICLRLLVAISYHQLGDDAAAIYHIDKAIDLALPDNLLGLLAEHRRNLDTLLDDRLAQKDEAALVRCKKMHKDLLENWTKLHNGLLSRSVTNALTVRQRELCRLAAFGLSDSEIAERMHVTVSHVKKELYVAKNKTGALKRRELGAYV
jgi:DNA-binding CsgD family transcriptional regulator